MVALDHGLLKIGVSVEVVLGEVGAVVFGGFGEAQAGGGTEEREEGERCGEREGGDDEQADRLDAELAERVEPAGGGGEESDSKSSPCAAEGVDGDAAG